MPSSAAIRSSRARSSPSPTIQRRIGALSRAPANARSRRSTHFKAINLPMKTNVVTAGEPCADRFGGLPQRKIDAVFDQLLDAPTRARRQRVARPAVGDEDQGRATLARHHEVQHRGARTADGEEQALDRALVGSECRRIVHAAVHRPDHDRPTEPEQQGGLARRYRYRLMDDVDAVLADEPARNTALRQLGREAGQEFGRQVGDLGRQPAADAPHGAMPCAIFHIGNVRVPGKDLGQFLAGARVRQQPGGRSARTKFPVVVQRQRRLTAELRGSVLCDDQHPHATGRAARSPIHRDRGNIVSRRLHEGQPSENSPAIRRQGSFDRRGDDDLAIRRHSVRRRPRA